MLDKLWIDKSNSSGFFCRYITQRTTKYAFTNYGISYGLQSWNLWPERVVRLNQFFSSHKSHDEYDTDAITHVMSVNSLLPGVLIKA